MRYVIPDERDADVDEKLRQEFQGGPRNRCWLAFRTGLRHVVGCNHFGKGWENGKGRFCYPIEGKPCEVCRNSSFAPPPDDRQLVRKNWTEVPGRFFAEAIKGNSLSVVADLAGIPTHARIHFQTDDKCFTVGYLRGRTPILIRSNEARFDILLPSGNELYRGLKITCDTYAQKETIRDELPPKIEWAVSLLMKVWNI